jgi:hypothetical protein
MIDEDNTDTSIPGKNKLELQPNTKRTRHVGPMVSSTSEEEFDGNAVVALPEGIEEQYGFKINPVSLSLHFVTLTLMCVCL